jgi:hypothetical protein
MGTCNDLESKELICEAENARTGSHPQAILQTENEVK